MRRWAKERWQNFPPSIRKASKLISLAIAVSFGLIVASYYFAAWCFHTGDIWMVESRVFSFLDNVLAGIVAFTMVGAVAFIFSAKKPEEDEIDDRIAYLYSARRNESVSAHAYLKEQVVLLGAAVVRCAQNCEFVELSQDGKAMRQITHVSMNVCNMMKRDKYEQAVRLSIRIDDSDFAELLGRVNLLRTTAKAPIGGWGDPSDLLKGQSVALTRGNLIFETSIKMEIPPSGELLYEYGYDAWGPTKRPFVCGARRFVEEFQINFRNSMKRSIRISPIDVGKSANRRTIEEAVVLSPGEAHSFLFRELPPTEDIETTVEIC